MNNSHSSNLTDAHYGYDFVVATTQQAINHVMKKFLYENHGPQVGCCYVDKGGKEVQLTIDEFSSICKTDPFNIPNGTDVNDPRIQELNEARFLRGWRARIGLPDVDDPRELENIVNLGNSLEMATFKMYCASFQIVSYLEGGRFEKSTWLNVSQPKNKPWTFTSHVDLSRRTVDWEKQGASLPPDVRDAVKTLKNESNEDIFGIEQLILDLETARLMTDTPEIGGVPKGSHEYTMLLETFLGIYFDYAKRKGTPLLSCVIKTKPRSSGDPVPTLNLTDFRYSVSQYVGSDGNPVENPDTKQKEAGTINYLCAVDGHKLPEAARFSWNWIDVSELDQAHGVIAIQRNTLANHLISELMPYILSKAVKPKPKFETHFPHDPTVTWDFSQTATKEDGSITQEGPMVYKMYWDSKEFKDSIVPGVIFMTARVYYNVTITFQSNTIVIDQHFWFHVKVQSGVEGGEAYIVDHALTDTYDIAVNDKGKLEATCTEGKIIDKSQELKSDIWAPTFNKEMKKVVTDKTRIKSPKIGHIPVSFIQDYVFPGGKAFVFKNVAFSDHQDLVSYITYADR